MAEIDLGPFPTESGHAEAVALDRADPLGPFRGRFAIDDPELIYLDGNSLGRMPKASLDEAADLVGRQWGSRLIRSWNEGWWDLNERLGDKLGSMIGADPGEVIVSDSTSINLHKLATAALDLDPDRSVILSDDLNFPSDLYVLDGVARRAGGRLERIRSNGAHGLPEGWERAIGPETALVALSHVAYKSGYLYDMAAVTELAHANGALVLWDLSHSVGVVPIDLGAAGVDLAVGCTYKYLNGGPGSPAFLYVREGLQASLRSPITGWWAHADPFGFDLEFTPDAGIRQFHPGTIPVVSAGLIEPGLDLVLEAGVEAIRSKSIALGGFTVDLVEEHLSRHGFEVASPKDAERRGSHVAVSHPEAWPINLAMIDAAAILPDFRAPDTIRLGLSPLYTRFLDVHTAVIRMLHLVEAGVHHEFRGRQATVT